MEERLLRGQEVATILQISRSYSYQLMREGKIRVVRLGRSVRVRESDLATFIIRNTSAIVTEQMNMQGDEQGEVQR